MLVCQNVLRRLRHVDPVRRAQRDAQTLPHHLPRHPREPPPGHAGGDRRHARLVPPDARVDDAGARGLDLVRQLDHLPPVRAARHQVQHAQPVQDDEVLPRGPPRRTHGLHGEAGAVAVGAPPAVRPAVGPRGDELVEQVALAAHDLHPVVAGLPGARGAAAVGVDRRADVALAHRLGGVPADGRLLWPRAQQPGVVGVAPGVEDLQADFGVGGGAVHCGGHVSMGPYFPRVGQLCCPRVGLPCPVWCDSSGDHEANAPFCSLGKVCSELLEAALEYGSIF
mmetsp:Transcript_30707/g.50922  ORF Transcript_30707/g.50922 Transcript_30707/m.50922 type:complete len:281 (-) Transcript_30707:249-1091(-)